MKEYIKTESGCRIGNLLNNPELLKVMTIKEKFVDQMEKLTCPMPQELKVMGATRAFVVLQKKNGNLVKAHRMDWLEHLCVGCGIDNWKKASEEASLQFDGYPQLFEN